jgi:hypothetical protein
MRATAVVRATGLNYRRLDYLTRSMWPDQLTGSGIPREWDRREIAVLEFVAILTRCELFPEGVPVEVSRLVDARVRTGDEVTVALDGPGWSVVLER